MQQSARSLIALGVISLLTLGLAAFALANGSSSKVSIPAFSDTVLNTLPAANWTAPGGNLFNQRHSSLAQVTPSNVSGLTQAWHIQLTAPNVGDQPDEHGGESSSIAYNGMLYTEDQFGRVYATDGVSGNYAWVFEPNNAANYSGPCAAPASCYPNGKPINMATAPANIVATATYIQTQDLGAGLGSTAITAHTVVAATRGVAIGDGKVYVGEATSDVVFGIDATTGKQVWATKVANGKDGSSLSMAPTYVDGKILMATSGGDRGASCIVYALDAKTGKPLWHFNLIPSQKGQPGYDTWTHPLPYNGGAAVWANGAVDTVNHLVYFGTGNPLPYTGVVRGVGLEYYSTGEIAVNYNTGKLGWFFSDIHHDEWDDDQSQGSALADITYQGKLRHAIVFANKGGLWYVLDRVTGKPIIPVTEAKAQTGGDGNSYPTQPIPATDPLVNQQPPGCGTSAWTGITAPNGQPFNMVCDTTGGQPNITSTAFSVYTGGHGASSQRPASIDPKLGLYFNESSPGFSAESSLPASEITLLEGGRFTATISASLAGTPAGSPAVTGSRLGAYSLTTGKMVWTVDHLNSAGTSTPSAAFSAGTMTTDSGLLFTASHGALQAYNSATGALLWTSPVLGSGSGLTSLPMTYEVNGKQYVAIYKDDTGDFYGFALPS